MNEEIKQLIEEHKGIVDKITNIASEIYKLEPNVNYNDIINLSIKKYHYKQLCNVVEAQLANNNIFFEHGKYLAKVAEIKLVVAKDEKESNIPSNN